MLGVVVVGVFIALNHQQAVGVAAIDGRTGQSGAPPDTIWCPSHVTQPLGFGAFDRWRICLLVAPNSPVPHRTGTVQCLVRL
jgi:hypothetical protein